jgi:acetyl esterase/lipase
MKTMTKTIRNIAYAPEHGFRGEADLYLPADTADATCLLVIHGGGWRAMDRFRFNTVCEMLAQDGYAALNANYRLTGDDPWPACGDDCVRAAQFLLAGGHPAMAPLDRRRIVVLGASAGGHLALMTGLQLPPERVAGIVDIAGPADLTTFWDVHGPERFGHLFGTPHATPAMLEAASPVTYVTETAPPLLCVHSGNDRLVPLSQSELIAEAYAEHGRSCEIHEYPGEGQAHGIWANETPSPPLLPHIRDRINTFIRSVTA